MKILKCQCGKDIFVEDDFTMVNLDWNCRSGNVCYLTRIGGVVTSTNIARFIIEIPEGKLPDHIDLNIHNNLKSNLRVATYSQNGANHGPNSNSSTGFRNVFWDSHKENYRATMMKDGKKIHIGNFLTAEAAARARDRMAIRLFGEFAWTNFPKSDYV